MKNNSERPLLSICIPTYNRAEMLEQTLNSIATQALFKDTDWVEIVISDNCSTDETKQVALSFVDLFPDKIKYFRNDENLKDINFELALSRGTGSLLKLSNDTLVHLPGSLESITTTVRENIASKDILFFLNDNSLIENRVYCNSMNEFVKKASFFVTWIGGFSIWKEDFDQIENFSRYEKLQLVQTDVLFRLMHQGCSAMINNDKLFKPIHVKKGGYNLHKVFIYNYLSILKPYLYSQSISKRTYIEEKKKLLRNFIYPWSKDIFLTDKLSFEKANALSITFREYKLFPFFYVGAAYILTIMLKNRIINHLSHAMTKKTAS